MFVGWCRCFVTLLGKSGGWSTAWSLPLDWDGVPIWPHGQLPDDTQLCEQSSRPQKGPAIKVAQHWADKRVCYSAVATAGPAEDSWHGLNACSSPYKASQSRSFPPKCTSTQECKLGVYSKTILQGCTAPTLPTPPIIQSRQ